MQHGAWATVSARSSREAQKHHSNLLTRVVDTLKQCSIVSLERICAQKAINGVSVGLHVSLYSRAGVVCFYTSGVVPDAIDGSAASESNCSQHAEPSKPDSQMRASTYSINKGGQQAVDEEGTMPHHNPPVQAEEDTAVIPEFMVQECIIHKCKLSAADSHAT